ncbi:hypothetical protein VI35_08960 [Aeromonas caviae]|nr:hypothetical protein VI35_08960 [Aeromonas caviae]
MKEVLEVEVRVQPFSGKIDADFSSGEPSLDDFYHKKFVKQWQKNVLAGHEVVNDCGEIIAFATMSATKIEKSKLGTFGKGLPYREVSFALIGRFAVDKDYVGQGVGTFFIGRLVEIALASAEQVGSFGVFVDALPGAIGFYEKLGFVKCEADDGSIGTIPMFLPFPKRNS